MRWHDAGLVLLALVAAGLTVLTFRATTSPSGPGGAPVISAPAPAAVGDGPDTGDGAPTSTLRTARTLLASDEPLVVAALGDSTGNETWEWVYGWARLLAQARPVSVVSWDESTEDGYVEPRVLAEDGAGPGGRVTIYSGHRSGAQVGYVVEHLDRLLPERPDLVILNFGHNNSVEDVGDQLEDALDAVRARAGPEVPVVLTLQQPQREDANADVRSQVQAFAVEHDLGVIDVAEAFERTEDPEALLADAVHPNEAGVAVWVEEVARTLRAPWPRRGRRGDAAGRPRGMKPA